MAAMVESQNFTIIGHHIRHKKPWRCNRSQISHDGCKKTAATIHHGQ
jgi:hypothetical protein